jgi:hypothetical protein
MAPASNRLVNPPYAIHNFAWKDGTNNDMNRDRQTDGILTSNMDTKGISVTASECKWHSRTMTLAALLLEAGVSPG